VSQIKLNIIDLTRVISGDMHGSEGDAIVAALAADPETIDELALAFARFTQSPNLQHHQHSPILNQEQLSPAQTDAASFTHYHESPFRWFVGHEDFEPYDAGILIIDLAARVVAVDSTYSMPSAQGEIRLLINGNAELSNTKTQNIINTNTTATQDDQLTDSHAESSHDDILLTEESAMNFYDDDSPDEIPIPYHLSDDWQFVYSVPEYLGICQRRREARLATPLLDARAVLYGESLLEFIAREGAAALEQFVKSANPTQGNAATAQADESESEGMVTATLSDYERFSEAQQKIISEVHIKWWMMAREDLQGKTPRQVLLAKYDIIVRDMQYRELQWSFTDKCPPPVPATSKAYLYAGFGTHEIVVYYDLIRYLLEECFKYLQTQTDISAIVTIEYLEKIKAFWLEMPSRDYSGRIPARYIELERQRIPFVMSSQSALIDKHCPLCTMSEIFATPGFWHLDGAHMDDCFEFSFYQTREEWEAEQRNREGFDREFNRTWREREQVSVNQELALLPDDEEPLIH
jgi:hypothetical protein